MYTAMPRISDLSTETIQQVERFIDKKRQQYEVPGVSAAIANESEVVYSNAFGIRDYETHDPITVDTRYSIASVTKLYTSLAILHLASQDELSLDDEITSYTDFWNEVPGNAIRISELLSHSSGMPHDSGAEREQLFAPKAPKSPIVTPEDTKLHSNAAAEQLRYTEDMPYLMYNTRGYQILGDIVSNVSGGSFKEYVEEELFSPMGMEDSQVGFDELEDEGGNVAHGYAFEDEEVVRESFNLNAETHPPHSGGGVLSTVTDMAKTAQLYLNDGAIEGTQFIDSSLIHRACTPQSPVFDAIDGAKGQAAGFGPRVMDFPEGRLAYHTGTTPGVSRAYFGVHRDNNIGVTLAVNTPNVPIGAIGKGITAILMGEDPLSTVPKLGVESKVQRVTGTYEGFRGSDGFTVTAGGNDSHILLGSGDDNDDGYPAFPKSTDPDNLEFQLQGQHGRLYPVTFHKTDRGLELRFNVSRLIRSS